jgi:hypothetical protein
MPGRHPSTTTPTPGQWDSPKVETRNNFPNELDMDFSFYMKVVSFE